MYTIITDSCSDLLPAYHKDYEDFLVLPLEFTLDGNTYENVPDCEISSKQFYDKLRSGSMSTTSQISPERFIEVFRRLLSEGREALYIAFSSGLSGTYNSARIARDTVLEEFPDGKLFVVDSLAASAGQGLLCYHALENRKNGMSLEENAAWVEQNRLHLVHWFTVDDLHFLKRGGRCSPAAAFFGTLVNIKPVLHVDDEGHLIAREKVRGRKSALKALVDHMEKLAVRPAEQTVFISHGDCMEDAKFVAAQITSRLGTPAESIHISDIGPVIGSHSGPGTVALFFLGTDRG
ncbi:DegV family protein [Beduinella massiliensis]|uniref:DegV family protein n=1 Tax=Beduinella massiliensis TaxID=1852363 RepID=UPI000C8266E7